MRPCIGTSGTAVAAPTEADSPRRRAGARSGCASQATGKPGWQGRPGQRCEPAGLKQAERLDDWLKSERKHLAHGMQKQIRKRQHGLAERQTAVLHAIGRFPWGVRGPARPPMPWPWKTFVRAADAMPLLHAENLHDFRKATKKARYVAESAAEEGTIQQRGQGPEAGAGCDRRMARLAMPARRGRTALEKMRRI